MTYKKLPVKRRQQSWEAGLVSGQRASPPSLKMACKETIMYF